MLKETKAIYSIPSCFGFIRLRTQYEKKWVYPFDRRINILFRPDIQKFVLRWEDTVISMTEPGMNAMYEKLNESCFKEKCPNYQLPDQIKHNQYQNSKKGKPKELNRIYAMPPCFGFVEAWRHNCKKWVYKADKMLALVYLPANKRLMLEWDDRTVSVFEPKMDQLYAALTDISFKEKCPHYKLPGGLKLTNTKTEKTV